MLRIIPGKAKYKSDAIATQYLLTFVGSSQVDRLLVFLVLLVSPTFRYLATYLAGPESQGELDRTSKERPRIAESKFEGHWWMFPGVAWRARRDRKYDMSAAVENELDGAKDRKRPKKSSESENVLCVLLD